jgi:hypothetical protein
MDRNENWEHLVLHMQGASAKVQTTLVFSDFRMFGRVLFHSGDSLPQWWTSIAPAIGSSEFTIQSVAEFMKRRSGITIKAALLMQERFPGIGNWMADEILWRACIHPSRRCGDLSDDEVADLHSVCVWVCKQAMDIIGTSFADPPSTWLYHYRWQDGGKCPLTSTPLQRETIGGRTSCFCPSRQKMKGGRRDVFMSDAPIGSHALVKSSAWKAQASSSSDLTAGTAEAPAVKHGKKRGRVAPADVKVEAEDHNHSGVSPWGRLVRTGTGKTVGIKVKVEGEEKEQKGAKRIKIEENFKSESKGKNVKLEVAENQQSRSKRIIMKKENVTKESTLPVQSKSLPQRHQGRTRASSTQLQAITLTERQQVIEVKRLQQRLQPRKIVKSKRNRS